MQTKRVVITGSPGTGKTVVVKGLESKGFYCYHEIIRTMTAKAKKEETKKEMITNPLVFVDNPLIFNRNLLEGRKRHYKSSTALHEAVCFFDRGMPDVLAYMDYFGQKYPKEFENDCKENQYDHVFILPPWQEIYVSDNERLESFEEAEALHSHLVQTYERFGYSLNTVPKLSVAQRISFILDTIK